MKTTAVVVVLVAAVSCSLCQQAGVLWNGDGSIGLVVKGEKPVVNLVQDLVNVRTLTAGYGIDAVLGSRIESLPNHVYGDLNAKLELTDWPDTNFTADAALRGLRIEASQTLDRVDYSVGLDATLMSSDIPNRVYRFLGGKKPKGAKPMHAKLGFTLPLAHSGADTLGPEWKSRLDPELFLSFTLTDWMAFSVLARGYNQPSDVFRFGTWQGMVEPVVTFQWGGKWLHAKYSYGGLPPKFERVSDWSVGVGFAFD